jgi:hypothetical protein
MENPELTLPPESYLPGAASLLDQLDKKILIVLVDGRHLVGILRSFDHFSVAHVSDRIYIACLICFFLL